MNGWHLAQINIGRLVAPRGDARVPPFFDALALPDAQARKDRLSQRVVQILVKQKKYALAITILEQLPESSSPVEEFPGANLRELVGGDYRIIYTYADDVCRIVGVAHGARDLRRLRAAAAGLRRLALRARSDPQASGMMKYLLLFAVLFIAYMVWRNKRIDST